MEIKDIKTQQEYNNVMAELKKQEREMIDEIKKKQATLQLRNEELADQLQRIKREQRENERQLIQLREEKDTIHEKMKELRKNVTDRFQFQNPRKEIVSHLAHRLREQIKDQLRESLEGIDGIDAANANVQFTYEEGNINFHFIIPRANADDNKA